MPLKSETQLTPEAPLASSTPSAIVDTPKNAYGIADWQTGGVLMKAPDLTGLERNKESHDFFQNLWPASEAYISALNPIFLADLHAIEATNPKSHYLVRDGILPLMWFFSQNPEPGNFKGKIRVHSDFEELVPDAWREQTELFSLFAEKSAPQAKNAAPTKSIKQILLLGVIMPSVCSLPRLESDLANVIEFAGGKEELEKIKIRAFLPFRMEAANMFSGHAYYNYFCSTLNRILGFNVEFIEYESLKWMYLEPGTWVHEFNEKYLYTDSYLSLLAMSKGGNFIPSVQGSSVVAEVSESPAYDMIYQIYPHVSCGVRRKFQKSFVNYLNADWVPETQERALLFYKAMNSSANVYPWPSWFAPWCKDFVLRRQE
jgi:hypothetical protein